MICKLLDEGACLLLSGALAVLKFIFSGWLVGAKSAACDVTRCFELNQMAPLREIEAVD